MIALLKKNIQTWGYGKILVIFWGCLIFSISERINNDLSYEQHMVSAVSDHYYLTYFMLPIVLLGCFSFLEDDGEQVILRFGSYHVYFTKKWIGTGVIAAMLICVQTAAVLLSGIGLETGNNWLLYGNTINAEIFGILRQYFKTPLLAFAGFVLYQLFGIWFISGICMWIGHFAGRKWAVRIIVAMYILSALWIKIPALHELPVTVFNHLVILHHNLGTPRRMLTTGLSSVIIFLLMLLTIRFVWQPQAIRYTAHPKGISAYYLRELTMKRNLNILCVIVLGIALYKGFGGTGLNSSKEWIFFLFAGHGTGCFQILSFLELLIINTAPLYLLAVFIEHTISEQSIFISIRTKGRKELMIGILRAGMQFLTLYVLLWFAGGILGSFFFGYSIDIDSVKMLFYMVSMKYLDMLMQYFVMVSLYIFIKQITMGFLVLMIGNMICILPQQWASWSPFGISSSMRIDLLKIGSGIPPALAFVLITFYALVLLVLLICFGYRKLSC